MDFTKLKFRSQKNIAFSIEFRPAIHIRILIFRERKRDKEGPFKKSKLQIRSVFVTGFTFGAPNLSSIWLNVQKSASKEAVTGSSNR